MCPAVVQRTRCNDEDTAAEDHTSSCTRGESLVYSGPLVLERSASVNKHSCRVIMSSLPVGASPWWRWWDRGWRTGPPCSLRATGHRRLCQCSGNQCHSCQYSRCHQYWGATKGIQAWITLGLGSLGTSIWYS